MLKGRVIAEHVGGPIEKQGAGMKTYSVNESTRPVKT
jgi:hypothetical protein